MNILFMHQNMPGQFHHLVRSLAADPANRVAFLTRPKPGNMARVIKVEYPLARSPKGGTHRSLQNLQNGILHGEGAAVALLAFQKQHRFRPDIVYGHPGWGEMLFVKDVFPDARVIHYCEFFYHGLGSDAYFDLDEKITPRDLMRVRTKNAVNLLSLEACDAGVTATHWQWRQHPEVYRGKIRVIHDGIDMDRARPDPSTRVMLPDGTSLGVEDEVVTYVNRNMEPCRGLWSFMDAAELLAKKRPQCRFLVIGGEDGTYYAQHPPPGRTYQEMALERLDAARSRVHFLGRLPHDQYLRVLQVSSAHVYLSSPFVLSWSMLEAMATGCVVIGSNTPPVIEVITDGKNGLLADFFAADEIAERITEALEQPELVREIRRSARQTVLDHYALERCLPAQLAFIEETLSGGPKTVTHRGVPQPRPRLHSDLVVSEAKPAAGRSGVVATAEPEADLIPD
jgi:glycosyltransferase involved in cell wall biosynthesis